VTSAVGPDDVSVDRSTLTGQRSSVKGSRGQQVQQVSLTSRLTGGTPLSGWERKRKGKRGRLGFWAKIGNGPARGPTKLGLGFLGRLSLRLSRPAQAYGLAKHSGPARPNRPAQGLLSSPPLSLTERA
jgi:hypothetical protein